MNKYFVVFKIPAASMADWVKNTKPEVMKEQTGNLMKDTEAWMAAHAKSIVERGMPLGKTKTVTDKDTADSKNDLSYYMIIQAESHDAAAKLLADHPFVLTIPTSSIDVMESPRMEM